MMIKTLGCAFGFLTGLLVDPGCPCPYEVVQDPFHDVVESECMDVFMTFNSGTDGECETVDIGGVCADTTEVKCGMNLDISVFKRNPFPVGCIPSVLWKYEHYEVDFEGNIGAAGASQTIPIPIPDIGYSTGNQNLTIECCNGISVQIDEAKVHQPPAGNVEHRLIYEVMLKCWCCVEEG